MSSLKFIYFSFQGRIDRRTWWIAFVLIHLGIASFNYVLSKLMNDDAPFLDGTWPNLVRLLGDRSGWITAMAFLVPHIAINTKRFHDRGLSGWWWLVFLIPFLVATVISISPLGGIEYPSPLAGWTQLICGFTAMWTFITLGFLPSKAPRRPLPLVPDTSGQKS
ncbi:MAG: DUF805 domain-containing protein [Rhodomicrobium sp.]|jgi:uncharacterized membrane protein YhaH (DUF805 family)